MHKFAMTLLLALLALVTSPAYAGKLSEGVFSIPWGEHAEFPQPADTMNCIQNVDADTEWGCDKQLGDIPVTVLFAWKHQNFFGASVRAEGYSNCSTLLKMFTSAWGPSKLRNQYLRGEMDDRVWFDRAATATWDYNKITDKCVVFALHTPSYTAVQRKDREAAKAASEGI